MQTIELDAEVSACQVTSTAIALDDGEDGQYITKENQSYFQTLDTVIVQTTKGNVMVSIQGSDRFKNGAAVLTLHDIGQNHIKCFQSYFCFHQTQPLLKHFTVYHINFPGQEENAEDLPDDYVFPTMDEMADVVQEVSHYFQLTKIIGFGVGAGANVFARLALKASYLVECLILVNGTCAAATWTEWGYERMSSRYLKTKGMTIFVQDYLMYYHFGKVVEHTNQDLVGLVRQQLHRITSPKNLGLFMESYSKRDALIMSRPAPSQPNESTIKCPVLVLTGDRSPVVNETVNLNSKLDPTNSSWIKIPDASSMVLEEQPIGVTNALVLFLQGQGYAMKVTPPLLPKVVVDEIVEAPLAICS